MPCYETNHPTPLPGKRRTMIDRRRSAWRFMSWYCLLAGLLLAATHGVSGGTGSAAAMRRLVKPLVRQAQASVDISPPNAKR